jgi:hypothetical protein
VFLQISINKQTNKQTQKNPRATVLSFPNNDVSGKRACTALGEAIRSCSIEELNLGKNKIGDGLITIMQAFADSSRKS